MNIILKTGFEKIKHIVQFQPETMSKAKKLVEANHVFDVEEVRENGNSLFIRAQVIRQTSVTCTPYKVQLNINASRVVTTVTCNCVYNQSSKCKHVAAVIYYINNEDSLSKTDFEQQWGKPTSHQLVKEKYAKGKFFYEMFGSTPKKQTSECCPVNVSELKDVSALKLIVAESIIDENEYVVQAVMSSLLTDVEALLKRENCEVCADNLLLYVEDNEIYTQEFQFQNEFIKQFYAKEIVLTRDEIIDVCCNTVDQSKCKDWFSARQCRISASTNCHSIKSRVKKSIASLVTDMISPKTISTPSLRYGIENESRARQYYKQLFHCEVIDVGVIISKVQPWLCASLDGIVIEDGCISKVLELKCPISCFNKVIVDFEKKECNVKYLQFERNEVVLKKSVPYYTQVQVQMYLSGLSVCDLFIYSSVPNGSCCVQVHRDENFLKNVITSCEKFYFEHYLSALYAASLKTKNSVQSEQPKRQFTGKDICNKVS